MTSWKSPLSAAALSVFVAAACPDEPAPVAEPTFEEKLARAVKLEDERFGGNGELDALAADVDGLVRARAALALGRIGQPDSAGIIASLLNDPSAYVRATAAFSMGLLRGGISVDALEQLRGALQDGDPLVRGRAAEALAKKEGEAAAEAIAGALAGRFPGGGEPVDWPEVVTGSSSAAPLLHPDLRLGLFALGRMGATGAAAGLLATEGGAPRFNGWPAAWTASELTGDELLPVHLFYAGSPDPTLRLYGVRGLGKLSPERARGQIRPFLFDPSEKVRIEAVRAAARLGDAELVPDLVSHLEADTRYMQAEILKAFAVLKSEKSIDPLIDLLGDESPWMRELALAALARQDPESFWLLLAGIGFDPDWRGRRAIATLLREIPGERASSLLREMIDDPDARVRTEALRSLAAISREESLGVAIQRLHSEDAFERLAAAETLAAMESMDGFAPVEQMFLVENEPDPRVRAGLLRALATIDFERARAAVDSALDDQSHFLREVAASLLEENGLGPVAVRPRSSERSLADYRAELEAPYSPQAFLATSRGTVAVELFISDAPLTVANFIRLAREGFFNGQAFYRVVPNGHVASGDPRGDGRGGPGYVLRSEINGRPILRGTLAMAEEERDAAGSRFFITHLPEPSLEGHFTVFGQVTEGMEIVDVLEPTDRIERVTIWDGITPPESGRP